MVFLLALVSVINVSCERELSDDVVPAKFPNTAEIFTDNPVGLTDQFFVSFDPATGANVDGFGVDDNVAYEGKSSIRIDVPSSTDPAGGYIGGIFRDRGAGRDLTGYNALTFWAKGSTTATIGDIGFGTTFGDDLPLDFLDETYAVSAKNIQLSTDWRKYIIPIPDPSRLVKETGLFLFAAGSDSTGGLGYTFWIDELKFENLGTIGQARPFINQGLDSNGAAFVGENLIVTGVGVTSNLANGQNISVIASPNYFTFSSSNPSVARAEGSQVSLVGEGTTTITAKLGTTDADGSLEISSIGLAPTPTLDPSRVISIFSDAYTNRPVDYFNGYWNFSTTQGQDDININGNKIIKYTALNFVGTEFQGAKTINASQMTHFHIDIFVENTLKPGDFIRIILQDLGADNVFGGGNDRAGSITLTSTSATPLVNGSWISVDVPFSSFPTLTTRSNLAQLVYVTEGTNPNATGSITNIFIDNIYFHN
ncbi:hypothetical protein GCM10023330_17750 [Litoribaculum gwangyangense]|uniref:Carbohydrate-binding protein n=2 Tax=Litoribaculum gwangyangense TaxID=1130722 RepID=A0ABP9CJQ6_9FLAO